MNKAGKTMIVGITGLILIAAGAILLFRSNAQPSVWALDAPVGISQRVPSQSEQFAWLALFIGAASVAVAAVIHFTQKTKK